MISQGECHVIETTLFFVTFNKILMKINFRKKKLLTNPLEILFNATLEINAIILLILFVDFLTLLIWSQRILFYYKIFISSKQTENSFLNKKKCHRKRSSEI